MTQHADGFEKVREVLQSGPRSGWVFGVCSAIARRTGWELWIVRLVTLGCALVMTLLTFAAYFVLAMLMNETRPGAQSKMRRWASQADRVFDGLVRGLKSAFADGESPAKAERGGHRDFA
ncbi:MAG: PspC domain-containing protein [Pseudomonadota bacterium]